MKNENRLIDAYDLVIKLSKVVGLMVRNGKHQTEIYKKVLECIADAPTMDAVKVIRCKKCIHYKPQFQGAHIHCTTPYCMRKAAIKVSPEDFCSFGEERKDAT